MAGMTRTVAPINFTAFLQGIQSSDYSSPLRFQALTALTQVLDSVPEGRPLAIVVKAEIARPGEDAIGPHVLDALMASVPTMESAAAARPDLEALGTIRALIDAGPGGRLVPAALSSEPMARAREFANARLESPATRLAGRLLASSPEANPPLVLWNGSRLRSSHVPALVESLGLYFGSTFAWDSFMNVFRLPQDGYRVSTVVLKSEGHSDLHLEGILRRRAERAGFFGMTIPRPPARGSSWVAKVDSIYIHDKRKGLGSRLLLGIAKFLFDAGFTALDADAAQDAGLFCVDNGFKASRSLYESIVEEFEAGLREKGISLTPDQRIRLLEKGNLANLAAFTIDGRAEGREFLRRRFQRGQLPVRFWLDADNASWLRLLNRTCDERPFPLEWESLQPGTRSLLTYNLGYLGSVPRILSSDSDHADHLLERLNNWMTRLSMFLSYRGAMREKMPAELISEMTIMVKAAEDVLNMLASHPGSALFLHFRNRIDPDLSGHQSHRTGMLSFGMPIVHTFLAAEKAGFVKLPGVFRDMFEAITERAD